MTAPIWTPAGTGCAWSAWVLWRDDRPLATLTVCHDDPDPRVEDSARLTPLVYGASPFAAAPARGIAGQVRELYGCDLPGWFHRVDVLEVARRIAPGLDWPTSDQPAEGVWADLAPEHPEGPAWAHVAITYDHRSRWPWTMTWMLGGARGSVGPVATPERMAAGARSRLMRYLATCSDAEVPYMRWRRRAARRLLDALMDGAA